MWVAYYQMLHHLVHLPFIHQLLLYTIHNLFHTSSSSFLSSSEASFSYRQVVFAKIHFLLNAEVTLNTLLVNCARLSSFEFLRIHFVDCVKFFGLFIRAVTKKDLKRKNLKTVNCFNYLEILLRSLPEQKFGVFFLIVEVFNMAASFSYIFWTYVLGI